MADDEKLSPAKSMRSCCKFHWRGKLTVLVPLITLPILIYGFRSNRPELKCIYLIVNMAIFWITECVPLYITSLFPIIFLPLFGILSSETTCSLFFTNALVMFVGGLILALAIEYSNLHHRIALGTILLVGCSPRRLLFGLTVVTCFLSMWMSNSACTAMMCPIVKAILNEMEAQKIFTIYMTQEEEPVEEGDTAYASSIGGIGTLIGTGTNLTFKGIYETRFPDAKEKINFPIFMAYTIPIAVVANILLLYLSIQLTHMALFRPNSKTGQEIKSATSNKDILYGVIKDNYKALGRMSCHEIQVASVFTLMVLLLFTGNPGFMMGWSDALHLDDVKSSSIVFLAVVILFALPTQYTFFKYCCGSAPFTGRAMDACLSWTFIHNNMPWGLCFLIGGGFALAEGSKVSGMAKMLGQSMAFIESTPRDVVIGVTIVIAIACTTFSSNMAVCNILTPVFCEMALAVKIHPLLLTLPSTLAMSFAYLLPVSTPPNAIVCGYANIKTKYMAVAGILPTLLGIVLLWINAVTWGAVIFPDTKDFPDWAKEARLF
ncbi:protein I'm not dead yet 2-like isoform X2 [Drosophila sulfurigaster albostrigata]|uniref:protein I'm not dead yet 2-like isoform X2 n=1 Tax=Drosophila sulfurigaster albostrigata TaxID=89887 RepID=UPI002D21A239|nr:protein I'm not dead yet 2-like isoform X2 [Drosophila sulfurigaster albostrigata]